MKSTIPSCISDAPPIVADVCRKIAKKLVSCLREMADENFPTTDVQTKADFNRAICLMMADEFEVMR